jgi:hypothetical protein
VGAALGAVFCGFFLDRRGFYLRILSQTPSLDLPAITAFLHLGQAILQTLVLLFGRLAPGLPLVTTPPEETKQLGNRTAKWQRFTDRHWTTSMQRPKDPSEDKANRPQHKMAINGTKIAKEHQITFSP